MEVRGATREHLSMSANDEREIAEAFAIDLSRIQIARSPSWKQPAKSDRTVGVPNFSRP